MTGRNALDAIHKAIRDEQTRARQLDADMARVNDELLKLDAARSQEHRGLAKLRIEFLTGSDIIQRLDDADRQVLALFRRRTDSLAKLKQELDAAEKARDELEANRAALADALEHKAAEIDEVEAAVQERLKTAPDYQAQVKKAHEAERVAVHADEKATQSEQEQEAKGASYRADPLFMYLYQRGFGTTEYRRGGLVRWLDGRVARLIGYFDARPNYARLLELPVRLREHADFVGAQADEEFAKLKQLDAQARLDAGLGRLEAELGEAEKRLAAADDAISKAASAYQEKLARAERYATGEDEEFQQAIAFLASEFGREDVQTLRREALATPFPDDDLIVARLLDLEAQRKRQSQSLDEFKLVAEANRKRVSDLERVRQEFTQRHYDAPGTSFANGAMVASVITQLVMGALTTDAFWRVLQQQRRYDPPRTDPSFGSGGFGRGTVWGGAGRVGAEIGGEILGEVLEGLGDMLGGMRSSGGSSSSRSSSRSGGSSFGGTSRARSGGGGSRGGGGGSRGGGGGSRGGGGGFRTGGKF